jgi:hypothetical protein
MVCLAKLREKKLMKAKQRIAKKQKAREPNTFLGVYNWFSLSLSGINSLFHCLLQYFFHYIILCHNQYLIETPSWMPRRTIKVKILVKIMTIKIEIFVKIITIKSWDFAWIITKESRA